VIQTNSSAVNARNKALTLDETYMTSY